MRRVHYVFRGAPDTRTGPLELSFDDGVVLLVDAGTSGQDLDVQLRSWEPLGASSDVRWEAFDVRPDLIGTAPVEVSVGCDDGILTSISLLLDTQHEIDAGVVDDELVVTW